MAHPNLEREMQGDKHLGGLGVKLSKDEALQRYQRTEAAADDDALQPAADSPPAAGELKGAGVPGLKGSGVGRLENSDAFQLFNSSTFEPAKPPSNSREAELAAAMQRDLRPAGKVLATALQTHDWSAAKKRLAGLLKQCGTESAKVLEGAMRGAGEDDKTDDDKGTEAVANSECRAEDPAHCRTHGVPEKAPAKKEYKPAKKEAVEKFQKELSREITPDEFDNLLTAGFTDTDGAGNAVKYGTLLRDHIDDAGRNTQDRDARKKRLGVAVAMVRQSTPLATETEGKPAERVYAGIVDGNAYVAIADEHNEIGAMEMVSYRRGSRKEVRKTQSGARTHSSSNVPTDPRRVRPILAHPDQKGKEKE